MRRLIARSLAIAAAAAAAVATMPAASAATPPVLNMRDTGGAVVVLQRTLGIAPAKGFFNRKTERAVKALQQRHGLPTTGTVGPATWRVLGPAVSRSAARFSSDAGPDGSSGASVLPWRTYAGQDMAGYRPSTYRGQYFDARFEEYRLCVLQRESGGRYTESSGAHIGGYQFSYSLAGQARYAMRAEMSRVFGQAGTAALDALASKPMYAWPRYFQDAAFWTVFNKGAGWSHWSSQWGANWHCDHRPSSESGWPSPSHWNYSPMEG